MIKLNNNVFVQISDAFKDVESQLLELDNDNHVLQSAAKYPLQTTVIVKGTASELFDQLKFDRCIDDEIRDTVKRITTEPAIIVNYVKNDTEGLFALIELNDPFEWVCIHQNYVFEVEI